MRATLGVGAFWIPSLRSGAASCARITLVVRNERSVRVPQNAACLDPRLVPLNATIGLLRGDGGWPRPLGALGYRLHRVEIPVTASATGRLVVVDVMAVRDAPASIVVVEGKSGRDIKDSQARGYAALETNDVRRVTRVPDGPVRVIYACLESGLEDIRSRLADIGVSVNLLSIGEKRARLEPVSGSEELEFDVELPSPPPRLIPVDDLSPDEEYRELLVPGIVEFQAKGKDSVTVQTLCDHSIPLWGSFGQRFSARVRERATGVLVAVSLTKEFKGQFRVETKGGDLADNVVHILRTPASLQAQGETQGWQALQRRAETVLRGRRRPVPPGQLSFEDLARAEKVGEDE